MDSDRRFDIAYQLSIKITSFLYYDLHPKLFYNFLILLGYFKS